MNMNNDASICRMKCKLSICGFSVATAFTSGLGVFFLGLMATYLQMGVPYVVLLGSIYKGYAATYAGSLIGGGWAFLCGLVCGWFFAVVYNLTIKMCCCHTCKPCIKE